MTNQPKDWEKIYDKQFPLIGVKGFCRYCQHEQTWLSEEKRQKIKSFICQLLTSQKKELKKRIERIKKDDNFLDLWADPWATSKFEGYNQALSDVIKEIDEN